MNQNTEWMQDPDLKNIPIPKLQFLQNMLFESKKYTGKELFPFFMSLATKAKSQNITYTQQEIDKIIPVLKRYASEDEIKKMDQVIKMFKNRT
ncbi:MAG: hypothetical protein IKW30_06300 [Lachnospiraceae bacterium]|nr:hypothetical protein [Lachnospiraceae bacterium]